MHQVKATRLDGPKWEVVTDQRDVHRLPVPGGWLYRIYIENRTDASGVFHCLFVPNPDGSHPSHTHVVCAKPESDSQTIEVTDSEEADIVAKPNYGGGGILA